MPVRHSTSSSEEWRDIPGYPGYQVSNLGRVRSRWKHGVAKTFHSGWHLVKQKTIKDYGRPVVRLNRRGRYVARLVLEAFIGPCPPGMECCHENDTKDDNRLENLSWGTRHKNMEDRERNGKTLKGERVGNSKLTDIQASEIRRRALSGESYSQLSQEYGISSECASAVARGQTFKHLPGPFASKRR